MSAEEAAHIEAGRSREMDVARGSGRQFLRSTQFWAIGLKYGFLILIQGFFVTWLPTYLVQARHFSLTEMGFGASLPWVAMFVMVFTTGAVGVVQVQIWSACQDLAGRYTATVSGWTNFWGNLTAAFGPIFTA